MITVVYLPIALLVVQHHVVHAIVAIYLIVEFVQIAQNMEQGVLHAIVQLVYLALVDTN